MNGIDSLSSLTQAIATAATSEVAATRFLELAGNRKPWQPSGIGLEAGQAYSLLATGRIQWSERHPQLHGGPGFHLWARVSPGGRIVNVTRSGGSFVADVGGELELGIYLGMWRDDRGGLDTPAEAYTRLAGQIEVCAIAWRGTARAGLAALAGVIDAAPLRTERARIENAVTPPAAWSYLLETGTTDIYRDCGNADRRRICVEAHDDQGIIRTPVDVPLTADTVLEWCWKVDEHPSLRSEDSTLSHDYVSIATEFDNGRDLTWIWSHDLPPETWFDCPIKAWRARETHYVVRAGRSALGQWCAERRHVRADVAQAMGAPPARIVAVWLIAVATFQHRTARAAFEAIRLRENGRVIDVL